MPAALFVLLAVLNTLAAISVWFWRPLPPRPPGLDRLLPPLAIPSTATVDAAVQRFLWTEYGSYGTVRIDRIERPARLVTGRTQWVRQLAVPPGGGRYEAFIGALDAPVTVRVARVGSPPSATQAVAGAWTRLTVDLDSLGGASQSVVVDIDVPPGGIGAWGSEVVIPLRRYTMPPDVVLISLDTVRRDQLTPYVPSLATTPALAALAQQSTLFDQAISTSSWTVGSHATLFTGRFPADSLGYASRVEPEEYTLPEMFGARGYRTFGVSGGPYTDPRWGLHQGFDTYVASGDRENARDATSRAIEWMEDSRGAPVFLFLNYFNAHEPLSLSQEVQAATGVTEEVPREMWFDLDAGRRPITAAVRSRLLRAYRAELTAIDMELRRLFDHLRRGGRWNRTLIIVWGDHGQLLGERGFLGHALTLEEELLRVPLIIKPAAGIRMAPGVYRPLIQNDDVFALSQTLAGMPDPRGAEILAAVNAKATTRRLAFSKIHHDALPALTSTRRWRSATQWAVRDEFTKIVIDLEGRTHAFDIAGEEERPIPMLGADPSLLGALERFRSWSGRVPSAPSVSPLSPAEVERLRSLGYIH